MRKISSWAAIALLALTLGGCQAWTKIQQDFQVAQTVATAATRALVSKDVVVIAVSGFNAAKVAAAIYLEQPRCPKGIERPTCRSPRITKKIATAIAAGTKNRDDLLDFAATHQGEGSFDTFEDLQAITASLRGTLAAYGIGG